MAEFYGKLPDLNGKLIDYYKLPSYDNYIISKCGLVICTDDNTFAKAYKNTIGYIHYRLYRNRKPILAGRHRLLAIVFIPECRDITKLFVNHINGIPGDDRLENLEWVTPRENVLHAGRLGLTSKCLPILVRDVVTGEISEFPSFLECATASGISRDMVAYRVRSDGQRIFPEKCQYKLKSSKSGWYITSDLDKDLKAYGTHKQVVVRNVLSGEEAYFDKQADCARYLGIADSTLSQWLSKEGQPIWPGFYQIKYYCDDVEWREVDDIYLELERNSSKRCVVVNRVGGLNVKIYTSAIDCARDNNLLDTTLNWRLKSGGKIIYDDGCTYQYYSDFISGSSPSRVIVK